MLHVRKDQDVLLLEAEVFPDQGLQLTDGVVVQLSLQDLALEWGIEKQLPGDGDLLHLEVAIRTQDPPLEEGRGGLFLVQVVVPRQIPDGFGHDPSIGSLSERVKDIAGG
jgi:hypothetical protein